LPVPAGPARPLQLVHVADLADALVCAAAAPDARGIFHVAEPTAYSWEHVARLIADAVGVRARVVRLPAAVIRWAAAVSETVGRATGRPSIFNRDKAHELLAPGWLCETENAARVLGFRTRIGLDRGLRETAQWYRNEGWL
ncbi:MAG: NAD-dependent epimerase/dehydratase family protein, partial [Longimicrobiales bacterium]